MASLLPAVHGGAPILAMSGGGFAPTIQAPTMSGGGEAPTIQAPTMSGGASLLPDAPPVHIAGMHGGASLLPVGYGDIIAMSGGGISAASFGITDTFPHDGEKVRMWKDELLCKPITETKTEVCASLFPFVDRRVQALLQRVKLPEGDTTFDMGCGTITRVKTALSISFDPRAITLLSSDVTRTFAAFRNGMSPHQPDQAKGKGGEGMAGLLQWMLGSSVSKEGSFDLITFMKDMSQPLPIEGFRQFLSYHMDGVDDSTVCTYAMKLYGYKIGVLNPTEIKGVYGWMFPPNMAARRVGSEFEVYSTSTTPGVVTTTSVFPSNKRGFTVYHYDSPDPIVPLIGNPVKAPVKTPVAKALVTAPAKSSAPVAKALVTAPAKSPAPASAKSPVASSASSDVSTKPPFSGIKNITPITVHLQQMIGGQNYTLRGMIQHDGGTGGGHYTYLYHSPTIKGQWVVFSDSSMSYPKDITVKQELNTGYIYLFEKDGKGDGNHKGITNHGNSCWMNAAIQMFYHIPEYRDYIIRFDASTPPLSSTIKNLQQIKDLTLAIQQIFRKYSVDGYKPMECLTEYQTLFKATFPDKTIQTQQDAMEFIDKVLLDIIEHVPAVRSLFEIQYESTITCTTPPMVPSTNKMVLPALRLPIPSVHSTLNDLLKDHSTPKSIDYTIGIVACKDATQTATINTTTTKYVIIQLMRFGNALS